LVSGAVGGVGRAAARTAQDKGAVVIAGVRKKQLDAARSIGADQVVALDDRLLASEGDHARLGTMALTIGTHLGPCEILALLGSGGMGEVYRVRDTKLSREVEPPISRSKNPALRSSAFTDTASRPAFPASALNLLST
jgi:hypothetical protein